MHERTAGKLPGRTRLGAGIPGTRLLISSHCFSFLFCSGWGHVGLCSPHTYLLSPNACLQDLGPTCPADRGSVPCLALDETHLGIWIHLEIPHFSEATPENQTGMNYKIPIKASSVLKDAAHRIQCEQFPRAQEKVIQVLNSSFLSMPQA